MAVTLNAAETAGAQAENSVADTSGHHPHEVVVIVYIHDDDCRITQEFRVSMHAILLDMMKEAVRLAGLALLPPGELPFDRLYRGDDTSTGELTDLDETVAECVRDDVGHPHFLLELARTFRVNNRWAVATAQDMTPREVLALPDINLDYQEFTLYPPDSDAPLALDTPICVKRGADFEAQRDGKYGKGPA
jgi:hypothetical protein